MYFGFIISLASGIFIVQIHIFNLICFIRLAIFLLLSANSIMQTNEQNRTVFNQKKQHRKYAVYLPTWRFEKKEL